MRVKYFGSISLLYLFAISALLSTRVSAQEAAEREFITREGNQLRVVLSESLMAGAGSLEIDRIVQNVKEMSELAWSVLPSLPENIEVILNFTDRETVHRGGVTGRADAPGVVVLDISTTFPGGYMNAVNHVLATKVLHEIHHLARGWTIQQNKFGPGIDIGAINEGLATVFSEEYAPYPAWVLELPDDGESWINEILALPAFADYSTWMNQHSDGRFAIGYRAGKYVVLEAMQISNMSILELTELSPREIYEILGRECKNCANRN